MLRFSTGRLSPAPLLSAVGLVAALQACPTEAADENPLHAALVAPEALQIHLQLRSRTEAIDGQFRPTAASNDLFQSFRTILTAKYDLGPFQVGGELRDARGYSQPQNSSAGVSEIDAIEPLQAYMARDLIS